MAVSIRKPFVLLLGGTSLTAGRLCTPPLPWTYYLLEDMRAAPECQGPVIIINTGKGSQTSNFGATQAALMAPLRPTHVLMEDFAINDCAIGPVSIPQATANFNSMVASYRAANPDVVIVHQTMSSASAADVSRANLPAYYDNGLANAALNGLLSLDNYYGTPLVPGGWPKPLPPSLTVNVLPPGYSPMPPGTTWNPADKSASITLSNGNLTGASSGAAFAGARATSSITGLNYFQVTINLRQNNSPAIGVASLAAPLNGITNGPNGIAMAMNGLVYTNSASVGSVGFTPAQGDVIGVVVDAVTQNIYFVKDSILSPAFSTAGISGVVYPALVTDNGDAATLTADFASPIAGDGLHPLWPNAFEIYSYPNILAWARQAMADFW